MYQLNTFGHGLIMLKLSAIEKKLQNLDKAMELKKTGLEILMRCIGKEKIWASKPRQEFKTCMSIQSGDMPGC